MPVRSPRLFNLAWPLLIELLLGMTVGIVGTAMAARLSDTSGAAFALSHHVFGTLFLLFRIVGAGVGVVITQALGAGRRDAADAVARAVLGASTWIGLAVALPAALMPGTLLRWMNAPAEVLPLAAPLLTLLAPAMLLDAWNATMTAVMRAHLRARDTLAVMVAMQLTHLALMGPLMFGAGPVPGLPGFLQVPALGLPGYAVALIAARLLAIGLHLWLWRMRLGLRPTWGDAWHLRRAELAAVARIGLPGAAENIAYRLAFMVSVAVVGSMGAAALATHAYAQQIIMVVLLFGLATGLSVVTENARVQQFADAADCDDLRTLGELMAASHASLRDDFEVSCSELDAMVEAAQGLPGLVGARMTGGGFGGSTINLVEEPKAEEFTICLRQAYEKRTGIAPQVILTRASQGVQACLI